MLAIQSFGQDCSTDTRRERDAHAPCWGAFGAWWFQALALLFLGFAARSTTLLLVAGCVFAASLLVFAGLLLLLLLRRGFVGSALLAGRFFAGSSLVVRLHDHDSIFKHWLASNPRGLCSTYAHFLVDLVV